LALFGAHRAEIAASTGAGVRVEALADRPPLPRPAAGPWRWVEALVQIDHDHTLPDRLQRDGVWSRRWPLDRGLPPAGNVQSSQHS
jgi:hypothetical protein